MARPPLLFPTAISFALLLCTACAAIVKHTFTVGNHTINRLCEDRTIVAINNRFPGPIIRAREGDRLIIRVINRSPYNLTLHWHGIFQTLSCWWDGPSYVTQCPIQPGGKSFTYTFNVTGQEGTLWYHAHVSWLRATVHGALIIRPPRGRTYIRLHHIPQTTPRIPHPFRYQTASGSFGIWTLGSNQKSQPRIHCVVGAFNAQIYTSEWWKSNVVDVEAETLASGKAPNISDAFTINGKPGHLYPNCHPKQEHKIKVVHGKTYLLRIINAALNNQFFFKIANHNFTVVAIDATYTTPYHTDVVVLAPGNTVDVLLTANQPPAEYCMAVHPYASAKGVTFDNTTTTGVLKYHGAHSVISTMKMPELPECDGTPAAHKFYASLTGLSTPAYPLVVPTDVDEHMFITFEFGMVGKKIAASMNNVSFVLPPTKSLLEAQFTGNPAVYEPDFPDKPPEKFDYTSRSIPPALWQTAKATRVKVLEFNSTVQMVLQNTAIVGPENHPIHIHGYNFYVLAQGFGNYDARQDEAKFNLVNPQMRNTIGVPVGGWAVIRFTANNPGAWFMHCHFDVHLPWGLGTVLLVKNGPTPSTTLPPLPSDYPTC